MGTDPLIPCGPEINGRYRIIRQLGAGGMGVVYEAVQIDLGRRVALKLIRPDVLACCMDRQLLGRFRREARLGSRLQHEGLVAVYDLDQLEDGTLYFTMELLNGRSMAAVLDHGGPLPWELAVEVGIQAAAAVDALHQEQIVHRDLKPDNLQLLHDGRLKVLDLGVVHAEACLSGSDDTESGVRTHTGQVLGTPSYMAPEQILDSHRADSRSDIYSLALTLYELCTGTQPFRKRSQPEVLQLKFLPGVVPPLRGHCPAAPAALESLLMQSLGERERRPETMRQMIVMLERLLPQGRDLPRQKLAERAGMVVSTPLPLWADPTDPDPRLTPEAAQGEAVARTAPAPVPRPQPSPAAGQGRLMGLISGAGVLLCLLAAVRWSHPAQGPVQLPAPPRIEQPMVHPMAMAAQPVLPKVVADRPLPRPVRPAPKKDLAIRRAEARGRLRIAVRPFGEIYLDGVRRPEGSPHTYSVAIGEHEVRAINTGLGQDETRKVRVTPGEIVDLMIDWEGS